MALVKTVELKILASAGDAQAQLDEVTAKADKLDGNAIRMRFRVDGAEGKAQLDAIKAKADAMGFKDVRIKVKIDGAGRAIADLEAVKHEMDSVERHSLMKRLGGLLGGGLGAAADAAGGIPVVGGLAGAGNGLGLAAVAGGAAALLPEVVAVGSGFAAAGAGAVAFGALARPAFQAVQSAYQNLGKAQQAYGQAQAVYAVAPTKAHASALKDAGDKLKAVKLQMSQMPKEERGAVHGIQQLSTTYHTMAKQFEKPAFKVFNDGLKVANNLLPAAKPLADSFAHSIDGVLKNADKATKSKGFHDFVSQFSKIAGPAVTAIGSGIGKVLPQLGKLLTTFSGKDVSHAIGGAFSGLAATIGGITKAVSGLMKAWDWLTGPGPAKGIAGLGRDIQHDFLASMEFIPKKIAHFFSGAGSWLLGAGKSMLHGLESGAKAGWSAVSGWLGGMGSRIAGAVKGAASWLFSVGHAIIQGLVNGMKSINLAGVVSGIASLIPGWMRHALGIHSPSKVMHQIGQQTIQGLILGLQGGQPALTAAVQAMGNTVAGPDSVIGKSVARLSAMVSRSGLGYDRKLVLTAILELDNKRLQALAARRKMLEQEIQVSEQVAQSEIQANSIMNAAGAGPDPNAQPIGPQSLITGMQYQAAQVRQFAAAIKQLKAEGLNSTSLSQIIGAGSGQGLPVAQALLSGGKSAVQQVNALAKQLKASAGQLGDTAAGPMYQAGVAAGQGLAKGIRSQLGAVEAAMRQLARSMVAAIRKDLKIHSPSLVFAEIGTMIPAGLAAGIDRGAGAAAAASSRLAASTVRPWARPGGGGGGDVHVHFHGITPADKHGTAQMVHQMMRDYKRDRGGAALGLG